MKLIVTLLCISIFISPGFSQSGFQFDKKRDNEKKGFDLEGLSGLDDIPSQKGLNLRIDVDEYYVDSGDILLIKVDRKGPAVKIFNSPVTPEGYIALPDIEGVYVRGNLLADVRKKIVNKLKRKYRDAIVEVYLFSIHPIDVTLIGPGDTNTKLTLNSSNRIFDVYSLFIEGFKDDSLNYTLLDNISTRDVKLIRENKTTIHDFLEFKANTRQEKNPYLQHEDIVYFSFKDSLAHHVSVKGAVANPLDFNFKKGDDLKKAFLFSGNLTPNADSSKIEITRFSHDSEIKTIRLSFPQDSSFLLKPDDRIYARVKKQYHVKSSVEIKGEVSFPGEYPIYDGKTRLADLISQAGGFTEKASLSGSKIIRNNEEFEDKEFERLSIPSQSSMNKIEKSYLRLRNREDSKVVSCDFEKLFVEKDSSQNIVLQHGDIIRVPKSVKSVYVSGGVFNPGIIKFNGHWNFEDYINSAGGYSDRAKEGSVKIIRNKTGNWIDAEDDIVIEENDIIFIPMRDEIELYDILKEGLAISAQLATLVLIFLNLK